jgi:hypothetical protein
MHGLMGRLSPRDCSQRAEPGGADHRSARRWSAWAGQPSWACEKLLTAGFPREGRAAFPRRCRLARSQILLPPACPPGLPCTLSMLQQLHGEAGARGHISHRRSLSTSGECAASVPAGQPRPCALAGARAHSRGEFADPVDMCACGVPNQSRAPQVCPECETLFVYHGSADRAWVPTGIWLTGWELRVTSETSQSPLIDDASVPDGMLAVHGFRLNARRSAGPAMIGAARLRSLIAVPWRESSHEAKHDCSSACIVMDPSRGLAPSHSQRTQ